MPRLEAIKNSFTAGELAPNVLGRTDLQKYHNGCEKISNFIVQVQGGLLRRWGTRYITDAMGPSRLIPFVISTTQSYMLEFGNGTLRFYTNDGVISLVQIIWNKNLGGTTNDGSVVWTNRGRPSWQANHAYNVGDVVVDSNGNIQQVSVVIGGGNSGTHPPIWNSLFGQTSFDASIQWFCCLASTWQPNTPYALKYTSGGVSLIENVVIFDSNGNIEQVTTSGTSGMGTTLAPYQINTPYMTATDDLWDLKFVQIVSVMYLVHPNHPPMKLIRLADTNWLMIQPTFYAQPAIRQDQDVSSGTINIIVSGTTITASAGVFIAGDVGKAVIAGTGRGYITSISGSSGTDPNTGASLFNTANVTLADQYDSQSYSAGNWFLRGGPLAYFSAGSFDGTNKVWSGSKRFGFGKSIAIRSTTDHPTDKSWQTVAGTMTVAVEYTKGFTDSFRTIDVGSYVPFAGGYGLITSVPDSTDCVITVLAVPSVTEVNAWGNPLIAPTPPGAWYLEIPAFNSVNGFPRAVTFMQDRLWFAGCSLLLPSTVWGSNVGDYENFALGSLDSDGIRFTINSGRFESVSWMETYQGNIVLGSLEGEYIINGGAGQAVTSAGAPITPTNINVIRQSLFGVDRIQPLLVDNDLFFVQKQKTKTYEFAYNAITSAYGSRNLNVLNTLITTAGFKEMSYQEAPYKIVWFTDLAGNLIGLTYDKEQDVWAWHRHFTGTDGPDQFISLSVIPINTPADEVWLVCKRLRNGVFVYTIEVMDSSLFLDCASHTIFPLPVTTLSGLGYLQGRTIFVVGDTAVLPSKIMDGTGNYTFPPGFSAKDVQVGINFISEMQTVRPEPRVTVQGLVKRWAKVWARIYQSLNISIVGSTGATQLIPYRTTATPLDTQQPFFTGDVVINNLGFDRDGRVDIQQTQPLPANILAVFGNLEISDGI